MPHRSATHAGAAVEVSEPYLRSVRWLRVDGTAVAVADVEVLDGVVAAKWARRTRSSASHRRSRSATSQARDSPALSTWRRRDDRSAGASHQQGTARQASPTRDGHHQRLRQRLARNPGVRGSIVGIPEVDQTINAWAQRVRTPAIA